LRPVTNGNTNLLEEARMNPCSAVVLPRLVIPEQKVLTWVMSSFDYPFLDAKVALVVIQKLYVIAK
jgi:hypothetical protein